MRTIEIREMVRSAVKESWPALRERHPRLAEVLEESAVADAAARSLADDPEYLQVMAEAAAVGLAGDVVADLVRKFVEVFLRRLI